MKKNINTQLGKLKATRKVTKAAKPVAQVKTSNQTLNTLSPLIKAMVIGDKSSKTVTANGAITPSSTGDKVLDFFSQAAAFRGKTEAQVIEAFKKAVFENAGLALKALFYIRDIRKGQGERKTFRTCFKWLAQSYPNLAIANFDNIALYGRFDDLFELFGTSVESEMMAFVNNQIYADMNAESPSLAGKWMPSINTSSEESCSRGRKFARFMGLSKRNYRRILSHLRAKIKIVETAMCNQDWSSIPYDKIPSRAGFIYRKAFGKHDKDRYAEFLSQVEKGEKKINTAALYPYDIVRNVLSGHTDKTMDVMWENLPNYFEGKEPANRLVVVDTSSSMNSGLGTLRPLDVSVSLGLYISERNVGAFKDWFITFSESPKLEQITGRTVSERITNLSNAKWDGNTNLQAVFDTILSHAVNAKVKKKDMPSELFIISDMQFDTACKNNKASNFEVIKRKYKAAGFVVPKVVFWNVNASPDQSPVRMDEINTILVSGCNPTILKNILGDKSETPYDFMLEVLNSERYNAVKF